MSPRCPDDDDENIISGTIVILFIHHTQPLVINSLPFDSALDSSLHIQSPLCRPIETHNTAHIPIAAESLCELTCEKERKMILLFFFMSRGTQEGIAKLSIQSPEAGEKKVVL